MVYSKRADVLVIALLAISIAISAVAASDIISEQNRQQADNSTPYATKSGPSAAQNTAPEIQGRSSSNVPNGATGGSSAEAPPNSAHPAGSSATAIYHSSPYFMPVTWGAFIGALVWRGKIRTAWSKHGYGYDTFRLMARMRGSPIRVKLLNSINSPKNRLQLANEFQVDWKTIDNHMQVLAKSGLVEEKGVVGTAKYYSLTEHGRRVLSLLETSARTDESTDSS